jgi:hypothetical protein
MTSQRDWPACDLFPFCRDFMNFITTGAHFDCANALGALPPQPPSCDRPQPPYAFLSARDLRAMVAAMID